jgi:uncharacterized protein (TIGR02596 family)
MKTSHLQHASDQSAFARRAFTLLELLTVIALIAIISAFALPAVGSLLRSSGLSQGAQMIADQLNLARQSALTLNRIVEVRFYQFGDPSVPGENPSKPSTGKYRTMQAFEILDSGSAVPLWKVQYLPTTVVIDSGNTLSSIIAQSSSSTPTLTTGAALTNAIPRVGLNYNCVSFRFLPDGSANFAPAAAHWFLTLHTMEAGDALPAPPPNFFALQINPSNGHIQSFRP